MIFSSHLIMCFIKMAEKHGGIPIHLEQFLRLGLIQSSMMSEARCHQQSDSRLVDLLVVYEESKDPDKKTQKHRLGRDTFSYL